MEQRLIQNEREQQRHLITIKELAQRLNVPVSWIYQRTRLGQTAIPHIKLGKYVRFDQAAVIAFFEKRKKAMEMEIPLTRII